MPFIFSTNNKGTRLRENEHRSVSWTSRTFEWHWNSEDIPCYFCGVDVVSELLRAGDILKSADLSNNTMPQQMRPKFAFYNTEEDVQNDVSPDVHNVTQRHEFYLFRCRPSSLLIEKENKETSKSKCKDRG